MAGGGGDCKYLKNCLRNVSDAYLVLILTFQKSLYSAINNTGRSHHTVLISTQVHVVHTDVQNIVIQTYIYVHAIISSFIMCIYVCIHAQKYICYSAVRKKEMLPFAAT